MAAKYWDADLPPAWSSAVTSDGRIFFLNDDTQQTTWLHPVSQMTVQTGHRSLADLPRGWERGVTVDGVPYYIDHNSQRTTLLHPITGRSDIRADGIQSPNSPDQPKNDASLILAFGFGNGPLSEIRNKATKKVNIGSWVKGPCLRQPDPSTISHQGWLLKQGSDGLHLWKRRWFVLSEYCLYYYKSPLESKVLGYIPLPSFKIRPVCPDDRVLKKFAFKAEHENTRSYFFAAESKGQMTQWMNALSLASILQQDMRFESQTKQNGPSVSSVTSSSPASPSPDDSDSGFHGYKSRRLVPKKGSKSPISFDFEKGNHSERQPSLDALSVDELSNSSRLTGERVNSSVDSGQGGRQPFYANAPPKPRRLNSSYENNSTPDRSPPTDRRAFVEHEKPFEFRKAHYHSSAERRTPEAYGATSTIGRGEYEDVYDGRNELSFHRGKSHQRESLTSSKSGGTRFSDELNTHFHGQNPQETLKQKDDSLPRNWSQNLRRKFPGQPRPHSADFLEYDRRHGPSNMVFDRRETGDDILVGGAQVPRPKSAVGYLHDGDFWSEENYAAKMRESFLYNKVLLQNGPRYIEQQNYYNRGTPTIANNAMECIIWQRIPPAGAATPDLYVSQNSVACHQSVNAIPQQNSSNSLSRNLEPSRSTNYFNRSSVGGYNSPTLQSNVPIGQTSSGGSFSRSASARVHRNKHANDALNITLPDDGFESDKKIQQREESMNRLLEWKQRMLQSPLTRKTNSRPDSSASSTNSSKINSSNSFSTQPPSEIRSYRQKILHELTSKEMQGQGMTGVMASSGKPRIASPHPHCEETRPITQGGGDEYGDGVRGPKRDSSRIPQSGTGNEARRTSSASRYSNDISSDEQDVKEERVARRKTRRTSRRSNSVEKSDSRRLANFDHKISECKSTIDGVDQSTPLDQGHDYVNVNSVVVVSNNHPSISEGSCSQRAVPVYVDDPDNLRDEKYINKGLTENKHLPVQSVRFVEVPLSKTEGGPGGCSIYGTQQIGISSNGSEEVVKSCYQMMSSTQGSKDRVKCCHAFSDAKPPGFNYKSVYDASSYDSYNERKLDKMSPFHNDKSNRKSLFQDDNSIGKYSDSGYDTLKTDLPIHKEEKRSSKTPLVQNSHKDSIESSKRFSSRKAPKRPETWSPDKFNNTWNNFDSKAKFEESQIVKEYSYEYITTRQNERAVCRHNPKDITPNMKMSSSDLPQLESPRIVQETQQQAASNRNLVMDRIKCFSSYTEENASASSKALDATTFANCNANSSPSKNKSGSLPSDELALMSALRSKKVNLPKSHISNQGNTAQTNSDGISSSSNEVNNSCSDISNLQYKDLKSPQDIMDSRINRSNIRKFVFDNEEKHNANAIEENGSVGDSNTSIVNKKKSVKELLKSFESKLEGIQGSYISQKEDCKRKFYSDSELLSNESSSEFSDREGQLDYFPPPPPSFLEDIKQEEETLSLTPPPRPPKAAHLDPNVDSKGRPKCIRLSLTESIEESLRMRSESETEDGSWYNCSSLKQKESPHHVPMMEKDLLPLEQAPPPPKMNFTKKGIEDNYLPMSSPKKPPSNGESSLALSSSNSSLSSKHLPTPEPMYLDQFGKSLFEEHTYIEMNGEYSPKSSKSSLLSSREVPKIDMNKVGEEPCLSQESPRYYEIGENEGQHYEYIYKTGSPYESIYMEVPQKESSKEEKKPDIPNKPLDLKQMSPFHKKSSSDSALTSSFKYKSNIRGSDGSSDADDEASKDLDSLELPKKPRFSLSDTFRPASYYLSGADLSTDVDAHDSSDSDLVPPPPIPTSPPPAEDMPCSTEKLKSKKFIFDAKELLNTPNHSKNVTPTKPKVPTTYLDGKLTSMQHYSNKRLEQSLANKLKRRPLLEETLEELDADDDLFIIKSEDIYPASNRYLDNHSSKLYDHSVWEKQDHFDESNASFMKEIPHDVPLGCDRKLLDPCVNENIYENTQVNSSGVALAEPCINNFASSKSSIHVNPYRSNDLYYYKASTTPVPSTLDIIDNENRERVHSYIQRTSLSPIPMNQVSSDEPSRNMVSPIDNTTRIGSSTPIHMKSSSNLSVSSEVSPRTAPYYYSDVIRDENIMLFEENLTTPRARAYQLNNQRDLEANKRQDVGKKVNQISNTTPDSRYRESLEDELKHSLLIFDGKTIGSPDERNVYEADTLRKIKARIATPDPEQTSKNIYPYGISLKSDDPYVSSHKRSQSMESLLEDAAPRQRTPLREADVAIHPVEVSQHDISVNSIIDELQNTPHPNEKSSSQYRMHVRSQFSPIPDNWRIMSPQDTYSQTGDKMINTKASSNAETINAHISLSHYNASPPAYTTPSQGGVDNRSATGRTLSPFPHTLVNNPKDTLSSVQYQIPCSNMGSNPIPQSKVCHSDQLAVRDGSASRLSHHDTFSVTSAYTSDWEDDNKWREQLRKASLRHSRSLETLDEPRCRQSFGNCTNSKLSLPNSPQKSLDEYRVDYREGRILSCPREEEVCRTRRRGLTSLEEYEWDTVEERFMKQTEQEGSFMNNANNHSSHPFLSQGLPPSSEKDSTIGIHKSPHSHSSADPSCKFPLNQEELLNSQVGGRFDKGSANRQDLEHQNYANESFPNDNIPAPDIIPNQDVSKLGEALQKRSNYASFKMASKFTAQTDSPLSNYSYGFGSSGYTNPNRYLANQNYPHNPNANNYHHYKNDDLINYQNHHPQPIQYQPYPNYDSHYLNYTKEATEYDQLRSSNPYNGPQEFLDYYQDYGGYDVAFEETEQLRQDAEMYQRQEQLQYEQHQRFCDSDLSMSKVQLAELEGGTTEDHLKRIAYLEEHLQDLDRQYQMGKPLINLVDNMVKLGSLYKGYDSRTLDSALDPYQSPEQGSLAFTRRIMEKRILAEDEREYEAVTPNQIDLEGKVMELYKLERLFQEESLKIQSLQKHKEMLEKTLSNIHARAQGTNESMLELERRNHQRDYLEKELSRLRSNLAVSARRLEETAAENNRLEHEMMMLRQKIQTNMARNAQRESQGTSEARHIESEMLRVNSLLEDLQKRRLELSDQIQRLTSTNEGRVEQRPPSTGISGGGPYSSRRRNTTWLETDLDRMITRDKGCDPTEEKRRLLMDTLPYPGSLYARTASLDEFSKSPEFSVSHLIQRPGSALGLESRYTNGFSDDLPLLTIGRSMDDNLINARLKSKFNSGSYGLGLDRFSNLREPMMDRNSLDNKPDGEEQRASPLNLDINEADERVKRYYGILPREKFLEPKTVRIVKRESTERKKDKFLPDNKESSDPFLSYVAEDEMESDTSDIENESPSTSSYPGGRSTSLPRNLGRAGRGKHPSPVRGASLTSSSRPTNLPIRSKIQNNWKPVAEKGPRPMSAHEQLFGVRKEEECPPTPPDSPGKSEPTSPVFKSAAAREIIKEMAWEAEKHRRLVPKEKRRHFTISSSKPLSLETGSALEEGARSRDDCDMIRALRPKNHPDVVKSTLSTRDLRFNESTIDTVLGAPQKIHIPERYKPDEEDERELSKEETERREEKAKAIRKMLTESSATVTKPDTPPDDADSGDEPPSSETSSTSRAKIEAERKGRERILAMNQILAKEAMEKSRMVAVRAQSFETRTPSSSEEELSPLQSLPLIQQRENFLV